MKSELKKYDNINADDAQLTVEIERQKEIFAFKLAKVKITFHIQKPLVDTITS